MIEKSQEEAELGIQGGVQRAWALSQRLLQSSAVPVVTQLSPVKILHFFP